MLSFHWPEGTVTRRIGAPRHWRSVDTAFMLIQIGGEICCEIKLQAKTY